MQLQREELEQRDVHFWANLDAQKLMQDVSIRADKWAAELVDKRAREMQEKGLTFRADQAKLNREGDINRLKEEFILRSKEQYQNAAREKLNTVEGTMGLISKALSMPGVANNVQLRDKLMKLQTGLGEFQSAKAMQRPEEFAPAAQRYLREKVMPVLRQVQAEDTPKRQLARQLGLPEDDPALDKMMRNSRGDAVLRPDVAADMEVQQKEADRVRADKREARRDEKAQARIRQDAQMQLAELDTKGALERWKVTAAQYQGFEDRFSKRVDQIVTAQIENKPSMEIDDIAELERSARSLVRAEMGGNPFEQQLGSLRQEYENASRATRRQIESIATGKSLQELAYAEAGGPAAMMGGPSVGGAMAPGTAAGPTLGSVAQRLNRTPEEVRDLYELAFTGTPEQRAEARAILREGGETRF